MSTLLGWRRPGLSCSVVAFVAIAALSCGGDSDETASQASTLTPETAEGGSLILYRDLIGGAIVAKNIETGATFRRPFESETRTPIAADCTRDGRRIVLVETVGGENKSQIIIEGADASGPIDVPGQTAGAAWSPDGERIAFSRFDQSSGRSEISILDIETGHSEELPGGSLLAGMPTWSPDGGTLAFHGQDSQGSHLFTQKLGGGGPTSLLGRLDAFNPHWSPDGAALLFTASGDQGGSQLFQVSPDGSGERQVSNSSTLKVFPRWSPDGSKIAFVGTVSVPMAFAGRARGHNLGVWTTRADGSDEQLLTDLTLDAWLLAWCPAGPWLNENWERG